MIQYIHLHLFSLLLLLLPICTHADELRIAAASNFYHTLQAISQRFEQQHPHRITIIKGSTGKLYAQILHGAPYDIFLSADSERPQILEQENKIHFTSRMTYALGKIALWSPKSNDPLRMLQQNNFHKMSIANPKTAPYGEAAVQTLIQLKNYEAVKNKLVYGENIAQTYQFVESGSADLGFVALSQVINSMNKYWLVPQNFYTPLEQQLVILKSSRNAPLAKIFVEFMKQDSIKELIRSHGYDTP